VFFAASRLHRTIYGSRVEQNFRRRAFQVLACVTRGNSRLNRRSETAHVRCSVAFLTDQHGFEADRHGVSSRLKRPPEFAMPTRRWLTDDGGLVSTRRALMKSSALACTLFGLGLTVSPMDGALAAVPDGDQGGKKMNVEPNLRENDPSLPPRARELIRIGSIGIVHGDAAALAGFFHPDFRFHGPDGDPIGREDLWAYFAACRAAFDDFAVTRQQIFSDGATLDAARTTFSGVFKRPFTKSPIGTIQPNGKPVFYKINNVFRYAPDGRLIEEWAQYDSRLLLERMGVRLTHP